MRNTNTTLKTHPITVQKVRLWRREIDATPDALAATLQPLADAGLRVRICMRYRHFRDEQRAVVEVCLDDSEDEQHCAAVLRHAGLTMSPLPTLLIEADNATGVVYAIAQTVAEKELNIVFCVTQTVNEVWTTLIGFVSDDDAERAALALLRMNISMPLPARPPT